MNIGINKVYDVKRYVRRKLVLNDKVVDYLTLNMRLSKKMLLEYQISNTVK